jgi:predicted ATPase
MPQDANELLGRRRELEVLDGLLQEVREGSSRKLVPRGEAGVGKSALLDHLASRAARTCSCVALDLGF